jgi:hypothetical protein
MHDSGCACIAQYACMAHEGSGLAMGGSALLHPLWCTQDLALARVSKLALGEKIRV